MFCKIYWEVSASRQERAKDILQGICQCTNVQRIKVSKKERHEAIKELKAIKKEHTQAVKELQAAEVEHNKLTKALVAPTANVEKIQLLVDEENKDRQRFDEQLEETRAEVTSHPHFNAEQHDGLWLLRYLLSHRFKVKKAATAMKRARAIARA